MCRVISELQLRRDPGAGHGAAEAREVVMELSLIPAPSTGEQRAAEQVPVLG